MKLTDFNISNNKISFNNPYYANLENLLNSNFNKPITLHSYLKEILIVVENWGNDTLDFHLKNLFGGYWNEEGLKAYNVEGKWFTFFVMTIFMAIFIWNPKLSTSKIAY